MKKPDSRTNAAKGRTLFWRDTRLPMIEGRRACDTWVGYREHTHPTWSVGIIDAGQSRVRLGAVRLNLRAGQVIVIPPGCVHSCNPKAGSPWSYRMFHLDVTWLASCLRGSALSTGTVFTDKTARGLVNQLESLLRSDSEPVLRERSLQCLVRALFRKTKVAGSRRVGTALASPVRKAVQHLDRHFLEQISLQELAALCGLSRFQLIRHFRQVTGLTPHAYQVDRRINHGRELLKRGLPAAEVAYATGFSDQSHFQRAFGPRVAATPAVYSKRPGRRAKC